MTGEPEEGTRLTAREIHQNILGPAEQEIRRPAAALLWSALASDLVIGFSPLAAAFVAEIAAPSYARAAAAAAYPLGFIFIIMARSELFTENTLVPVIPFLERRDRRRPVGRDAGGGRGPVRSRQRDRGGLLVALLNHGQVAADRDG